MATVTIHNGLWRNTEITNITVPLVRDLNDKGRLGPFITVRDEARFGAVDARIYVQGHRDYTIHGETHAQNGKDCNPVETVNPFVNSVAKIETDAEVIARINERFEVLDRLTFAAAEGAIRSLVVSGAAGVGKSYGVEATLSDYVESKRKTAKSDSHRFISISGKMRPIALYMKLYEYRHKTDTIVLDDCDSVFNDQDAVNVLKAALDSKKTRTIHWGSDAAQLRDNDVPRSFEFEGSVIFITNIDVKNLRDTDARKPHLDALLTRSHYLDLTVHTQREKMLRIESLILSNGMLDNYAFDDDTCLEIMEFVQENAAKIRNLNLRTVINVADLASYYPTEWKKLARVTVVN